MFHYFTIKFHFSFFASFRLFSLQIFRFTSLEAKFKSIFLLFFIFSLFSLFFAFFSLFFALNFSLRFDLVIFASKRNKVKRKSSLYFRFFRFFHFFVLFFAFFRFFSLFSLFFPFFCWIFVSLRFFHLIFAYFTFVFASDFWCFASKWIMWNQAFFSLPSETKFSLQF